MAVFSNAMIWLVASTVTVATARAGIPAVADSATDARITEITNRDKTGTTTCPEKQNGPQTLQLSGSASRQNCQAERTGISGSSLAANRRLQQHYAERCFTQSLSTGNNMKFSCRFKSSATKTLQSSANCACRGNVVDLTPQHQSKNHIIFR